MVRPIILDLKSQIINEIPDLESFYDYMYKKFDPVFGKAACWYKEVLNNGFLTDTTTNLPEQHHKELNGF